MVDVDMTRRWDDVDAILHQGDGSALFAIQFRKANPPAGFVETIAEYWQRIDAVQRYKRSVSMWRDDGTGRLSANRDAAREYRFWHPGCSFAAVVEHVAKLNEAAGDG